MPTLTISHPAPTHDRSTDPVQAYLRDIGKIRQLTPDEELCYAKQVQQMRRLLDVREMLEQQLHRSPTSTEWQRATNLEPDQFDSILQQGKRAKQRMIEANLRLVVAVAKKHQNRGLELLDLIQEGALGLERAVDRFDIARGCQFSTCAYHWIRQAIIASVYDRARSIRLPRHMIERLNRLKKTRKQLAEQLARTPSVAEIAAAMQIESAVVRYYIGLLQKPLSLEMKVGIQEKMELHELLPAPSTLPEEYVDEQTFYQKINHTVHQLLTTTKLTKQEREITLQQHGFGDREQMSLAEIGRNIKLTRQQVQKINQSALKKLRTTASRSHLERLI